MDAFCYYPSESSLHSNSINNVSAGFVNVKEVEQMLQHKCKVHAFESCNLIHLRPNSKNVRVCYACVQAQSIPHQELLHISQLENSKPEDILPFYPILEEQTSKNIREMIGSVDSLIDEVNDFYTEMTSVIVSALEKSRVTQKLKINQLAEAYQQTLNSYHEVSKIKEFQGIFKAAKDSKDLDDKLAAFINEQHKKSKENTQIVKQSYQEFQLLKNKFSLDKPREIVTQVSNILKQLDLFAYSDTLPLSFNQPNNQQEQQQLFQQLFTGHYPMMPQNQIPQQKDIQAKSLLSSIVFVPQRKGRNQSQAIEIERQSKGQIAIRNKDELNIFGTQCHLSQALNANEKYVIRLVLHNYQQTSQIRFGLIEASSKKAEWVRSSEISYMEVDGGEVTTIIKGGQLHCGVNNNIIGIKELEVRIHQAGRVFKVGSYPDYLNAASLVNLDKIKQDQQYFFAISIQKLNDKVIITDFLSVKEFDDNM